MLHKGAIFVTKIKKMIWSLPDELLINIASRLHVIDNYRFAQTCRKAQAICHDLDVQRHISFDGMWPDTCTMSTFQTAANARNFGACIKLTIYVIYTAGVFVDNLWLNVLLETESIRKPIVWVMLRPPWNVSCRKEHIVKLLSKCQHISPNMRTSLNIIDRLCQGHNALNVMSVPKFYYRTGHHRTATKLKFRIMLVDWLFEVYGDREKQELQYVYPEFYSEVYLGVSIVDRSQTVGNSWTQVKWLQLFGVIGIILASRIQDREPISIREALSYTNEMYNEADLLLVMSDVIERLDGNLFIPTAYQHVQSLLESWPQLETHKRALIMRTLDHSIVSIDTCAVDSMWLALMVVWIGQLSTTTCDSDRLDMARELMQLMQSIPSEHSVSLDILDRDVGWLYQQWSSADRIEPMLKESTTPECFSHKARYAKIINTTFIANVSDWLLWINRPVLPLEQFLNTTLQLRLLG